MTGGSLVVMHIVFAAAVRQPYQSASGAGHEESSGDGSALWFDRRSPLGNTPLSFWTTKPETIIGSLAPTLDIFRQGWASEWTTEEMKKTKWLKRWFDDGIWPGEMEVFESAVDGTSGELVRRYYHRFNMNRDDWGDFEGTSLNGVELNSDAAVQELMKDPVEFRNSTTFDVTDKDAASPLTSGLRFLNMIGSDKGGFTTLEFRRKPDCGEYHRLL